jgi:ribosomal protein S18 acetylase RimI-like enzyme
MAVLSQDATNRGLGIRKATVEDLPALLAIVNASYSKYLDRMEKPPAPMVANYTELPKTQDIFILESISDDNGHRIIGSITLGIDVADDAVKVNNFVIEPAAQGRGYGRVMMGFAENVAREKDIGSLTLCTNVKMLENISLYLKLGFVETERRSEDGYDRVYFRKQLQD